MKQTLNIILGMIVFTVVSICFTLVFEYKSLNYDFKGDVVAVNRLFTQQVSSIETILISLAGLHHASNDLNQAELSSFSEEMLKAYPFIDMILGGVKVKSDGVKQFELRMRKQGYVNLKLVKKHETDVGFYLPVNFVEPMTPMTASILGIDIYSQTGMKTVLTHAIQTGGITASKISRHLNFKKPSIVMFKALYLGRYPPEMIKDRTSMLHGVVFINVDINKFMMYLDLNEFNLTGSVSNLSESNFTQNRQNTVDYNVSLSDFVFTEKFRMYEQNYQLKLERNITFNMIDKKTIFMHWLIAMFLYYVVVIMIKKRKASENEIKYLAYFDSLTTLPNRASFKGRLRLALDEAEKKDITGAVLFMDIDEFKRINDTLGHDVGDELLKQVSTRLTLQMRQGDAISLSSGKEIKDIVTRLGGDEFTILLTDIKNKKSAGLVANRILEHISQPFNLNDHEVYVTSSIGIAVFPRDGADVDKLLKYADTAMYHAKSMGKNNYQFYNEKMSFQNEKRLDLEEKLHQALEKNEFKLYYQPQIDAKTNKIVSAEALIRWQQSELGMIMPNDFIPLAEETGQIFKIGEWVINEACRQNKQWQMQGLEKIRIAVNLSGLQFMQDDLCETINAVLVDTELKPECLELEITESIMMRNIDQTISIIKNFTDMGISVSVDDFGTGYSSLSYLKKFPLESLKIDRSFVMDIPDDTDDMMITSAIISMAKSLKLKVIAEGVENKGQIEYLKKHDCDLMQGYYFSRPVPADEFEKLLKNYI
jgi:diguanylate cyclase (GGDEF)-like protein